MLRLTQFKISYE